MKQILLLAALIGAVFAIYYQSFDNPLIFDSEIVESLSPKESIPLTKGLNGWGEILFNKTHDSFSISRDLTTTTFSSISLGVYGQNVLNVLIHAINSLLLYLLISRFYSKSTSYFIALFFAVNPAAIYSVAYLIQRSQLLMMMFGLLQCLFYLSALKSKNWLSPLFFAFSLFCFKMVCFSKGNGVVFFAAYPLLSFVYPKEWHKSLSYMGLMLVIGVALIPQVLGEIKFVDNEEYYKSTIEASCSVFLDKSHLFLRSVFTQCGLYFQYLVHWFLPLPSSIDMKTEFTGNHWNLLGFLSFIIVGIVLLALKTTRLLGLGVLLSVCFFVPELSRTRIGEIFVLYRSYIWSLGYMIAFGWGIDRVKKKIVLAPILLVMACVTFLSLKQFDSESKAWVHAADLIDLKNEGTFCQGARAYNNAGASLLKEGRFHAATRYFKQSSEMQPTWDLPVSNLGSTFYLLGDFESARPYLNRSLETHGPIMENAQNILNLIDHK